MTDTEIVTAIVHLITTSDARRVEGSDAATERDLETFDEIVEVLKDAGKLTPPRCTTCGHVCPTDTRCEKCGADPMAPGDRLCVECDRDAIDAEELHRADDPHCTCNDCIAHHAAHLED